MMESQWILISILLACINLLMIVSFGIEKYTWHKERKANAIERQDLYTRIMSKDLADYQSTKRNVVSSGNFIKQRLEKNTEG